VLSLRYADCIIQSYSVVQHKKTFTQSRTRDRQVRYLDRDIDSTVGSLHHANVGSTVMFLRYAASFFRVKVSS
jgi:hypothetical protein